MNDKSYVELSISVLCKIDSEEKEKVLKKLNDLVKKAISNLDLISVKSDINCIEEHDLLISLANTYTHLEPN